MFCTKCGQNLKEGSKFCTGCGANVSAKTVPQQQAAAPITPAPAKKNNTVKIIIIVIVAVVAMLMLFILGIIGYVVTKAVPEAQKKAQERALELGQQQKEMMEELEEIDQKSNLRNSGETLKKEKTEHDAFAGAVQQVLGGDKDNACLVMEEISLSGNKYTVLEKQEAPKEKLPFKLPLVPGEDPITIIDGKRVVYASSDLPKGAASFKVHIEQVVATDFQKEANKYIKAFNTDVEMEFGKYKAYLNSGDGSADSQYSGAVSVGCLLVPEMSTVVTVYFFDTEHYNAGKVSEKELFKALVQHIINNC